MLGLDFVWIILEPPNSAYLPILELRADRKPKFFGCFRLLGRKITSYKIAGRVDSPSLGSSNKFLANIINWRSKMKAISDLDFQIRNLGAKALSARSVALHLTAKFDYHRGIGDEGQISWLSRQVWGQSLAKVGCRHSVVADFGYLTAKWAAETNLIHPSINLLSQQLYRTYAPNFRA